MRALYLISVTAHILAAVVWAGGLIFFSLAIVPAVQNPQFRGIAGPLIRWLGRRFRPIAWLCFAVLVTTGILNLGFRGYVWSDLMSGALWSGPFGHTLLIKLTLVGLILILSAIHDFYLGPLSTELMLTEPESARLALLRGSSRWIGRANLLLAVVVIALAVILVRGGL